MATIFQRDDAHSGMASQPGGLELFMFGGLYVSRFAKVQIDQRKLQQG